MYDRIMVRFGELSTKGKNKKDFINLLRRNIQAKLISQFFHFEIETYYDHLYIVFFEEDPYLMIKELQEVSGIQALSLVTKVNKDINIIKETAFYLIENKKGETFKLIVKRADKSFPLRSEEIIRILAKEILSKTNLRVNVHKPDLPLNIEIRQEGAYLFFETFLGLGGLPLGSSGKVMMMLSGGIDSPVASYLLMKRGVSLEFIHFASPPYTSSGVITKIKDLVTTLLSFQDQIVLHIVPFTKLQEAIYEHADESYAITLMRRMMFRLSEKLAYKRKCLAVASGESLGQVSSQTLDSIKVINEVSNFPILRPLITYDKNDIINLAKRINTYEISIIPYEDCCTIFNPKNPKTKPRISEIMKFEEQFNYQELIAEALLNTEKIILKLEK
ncbi:MAG: tRNA uracil 4-sulfurtransferase ThiI [Bacilli bacterium]|jgi:thiamine biosynthesis protein ThiI|nr:tRNA uracil 4-sulfurtransferase ThiI [Bacilli bacterium]NLN80698.1 tRNA 4-thiouridine(8) synthase ThiI [Erysipelotrichia bacterium]